MAVDVFLATAEQLLARGVTCVLEYVVRVHRQGDLDRIMAVADCVVVMTACADPAARLRDHNATDRLIANAAVLRAAGFGDVAEHAEMSVRRMAAVAAEMRTEFPLPTLEVDTTDGYRPRHRGRPDLCHRRNPHAPVTDGDRHPRTAATVGCLDA